MKKIILTEEESLLNEQELFFNWLLEKRVDFTVLAIQYNKYLERLSIDNRVHLHSMSIPLTKFFDDKKDTKSQEIFYKCKAAFNLLKLKVYKGTPYEKVLKDYVDEYGYSEDNQGIHSIKNLK